MDITERLNQFFNRLYSDYVMPSRMEEYRQLNIKAKELGYSHMTMLSFVEGYQEGKLPDKVFINRHDIDTDLLRAAEWNKIETELSITATYYFRLDTAEPGLMDQILRSGSEIGYHYEEVASYAYRMRIRSKEEILTHLEPIRALFRKNLEAFNARLSKPVRTIASHGDFVNRMLDVPNHILLEESIRASFSLVAEAYDPWLLEAINVYISDRPHPERYHPLSPQAAMEQGMPVICLLTHPRHWGANPSHNLNQDMERLGKGLMYQIPL